MKLDICIPTVGRKEKLNKCVNSILQTAKEHTTIKLFFSDEFEYREYRSAFMGIANIQTFLLNSYRVPNFWNWCLQNSDAHAMMYLNDDVTVLPDTLDNVEKAFTQLAPDFDAVLGINQVNLPEGSKLESAFGVIGLEYAKRFKDKNVWCLDYSRFYADKELMLYARKIGRFYYCPEIQINHYHGSFYGEDDTHKKVRQFLSKDKQTFNLRQEKGLLWGDNDINCCSSNSATTRAPVRI